MEVHVGIETHGPPTKARLDVLRSAAARFTDNKASIRVTHEPMPDRHCLITYFTMRMTAQYKVVDEIAAGFKMAIWDFAELHGHVDYFSKTPDEAAPQESQAAIRGCRWPIALRCTVLGFGIANTTANERFKAGILACAC